jgi:hypothetical protein
MGTEPTVTAPSPVERNPMTIHLSSPIGNENTRHTADDADQYLDVVACPECSMAATVHRRGYLDSTDGPVEHIRVTCVNRHWFLMPADMLNERPQHR